MVGLSSHLQFANSASNWPSRICSIYCRLSNTKGLAIVSPTDCWTIKISPFSVVDRPTPSYADSLICGLFAVLIRDSSSVDIDRTIQKATCLCMLTVAIETESVDFLDQHGIIRSVFSVRYPYPTGVIRFTPPRFAFGFQSARRRAVDHSLDQFYNAFNAEII